MDAKLCHCWACCSICFSFSMSSLKINGVEKSFGRRKILNDLTFSCKTGDIIGIFGRNGSGKSTLLKGMMGTEKMDSIEMEVDGKKVEPSEIIPEQIIGYLPQDSFLPKEMKVREVIPLLFSKGEDQDKIFYSAGVCAFENVKVGKLAAGQLKYLELLLLAHLPQPFLLLDEPFSFVEPLYIEQIKALLLSLRNSKGLIVTDHYYNHVLEIATHMFVLKDGRLFPAENEDHLAKLNYLKENEL